MCLFKLKIRIEEECTEILEGDITEAAVAAITVVVAAATVVRVGFSANLGNELLLNLGLPVSMVNLFLSGVDANDNAVKTKGRISQGFFKEIGPAIHHCIQNMERLVDCTSHKVTITCLFSS